MVDLNYIGTITLNLITSFALEVYWIQDKKFADRFGERFCLLFYNLETLITRTVAKHKSENYQDSSFSPSCSWSTRFRPEISGHLQGIYLQDIETESLSTLLFCDLTLFLYKLSFFGFLWFLNIFYNLSSIFVEKRMLY